MQQKLTPLFPPINFAALEDDLYRSGMPTEINFEVCKLCVIYDGNELFVTEVRHYVILPYTVVHQDSQAEDGSNSIAPEHR
jgi:hypothetical protein